MDGLVYLGAVGILLLVLLILDATGRRSGLPEPKGIPILGLGLKLAFMPLTDIYPWIEELLKKYGPVFEVNIAGFKTVILTDPVEAEILLSSMDYIEKGREYFILKPWLREGLLLSSGGKWRQRRKLLTPTFHFKILEDSVSRQANNAELFVESLLKTNGQPTAVEEAVRSSTLNVICETALGLNMQTRDKKRNEYVQAIKSITTEATEWFLNFWLHCHFIFRFSSLGKSYYRNLSTIHTFSEKVILDRKNNFSRNRQDHEGLENGGEKKRFAFLDRLLELDAEFPGMMSVYDIQEEVDTFTFEGHDTTSAALVFALFLLANHQDIQEKAANEQVNIFGSDKRQPRMKDLQEMTYLEMIIKETLRLYPSVPMFTRKLNRDLTLNCGKVIPSGYNVMVFPLFIHRNENYWDNPSEFCPERFSSENTRHPFCYIPFSAGARNCIGQKFAMMEMKMILSTVLRNCRLEPVTREIKLVPNIILKSDKTITVKAFPRKISHKENSTF